jgi:hypothetical protein
MLRNVFWLLAFVLTSASSLEAAIISQWDFNSNPADASTGTGTTAPSLGSGIASLVGTTATFAVGSGGGTDNTGWNLTGWAAQGTGSGTRGAQFTSNTSGFNDISVTFDARMSGTVSRFFELQATLDGTNYSAVSGGTVTNPTLPSNNTVATLSTSGLLQINSASGAQEFAQGFKYTFANGSVFENNANFGVRLVAVFDPASGANYVSSNAGSTGAYRTTGTFRIDNVSLEGSITAVPEPTSIALVFFASATGLVGVCRSRTSKKARSS